MTSPSTRVVSTYVWPRTQNLRLTKLADQALDLNLKNLMPPLARPLENGNLGSHRHAMAEMRFLQAERGYHLGAISLGHQHLHSRAPPQAVQAHGLLALAHQSDHCAQQHRGLIGAGGQPQLILVHVVVDALESADIMAMQLRRVGPQLYARKSGVDDRSPGSIKANDADIVAEHRMAGRGEPGGERRFSRTRMTCEGHGNAVDHHRIGVQRIEAPLMDQDSQRRAQKEQPQISLRALLVDIDGDRTTALDPEPPHAWKIQQGGVTDPLK